MLSRIKKRHIALITMLALLAVASIFYLSGDQNRTNLGIRTYDPNRDYQTLVSLINANKFWLSENPDFSPEKFLGWQAPNMDPSRKGEARIDVVEVEDKASGFVSFYMKSSNQGFIWLLAIDEKYRGKGLGERLAVHALSTLKARGAQSVILHTRLINKPALKLYYKLGFVEQSREQERGMVTLIKRDL